MIMTRKRIRSIIRESVEHSPHRDRVKKIALFGSYLKGTQKKTSDIDLLVEFSKPISLFELDDFERSISRRFHKKVDLLTPASLSVYFRDKVLKEAKKVYERK